MFSDTASSTSLNPPGIEEPKNEVLSEPSVNQKGGSTSGQTGQLPTQRHGWLPTCCLKLHDFAGSVQKAVLLVTCHKQEIFISVRADFHVLGKFPSCFKRL